jgi:hypothetical protein
MNNVAFLFWPRSTSHNLRLGGWQITREATLSKHLNTESNQSMTDGVAVKSKLIDDRCIRCDESYFKHQIFLHPTEVLLFNRTKAFGKTAFEKRCLLCATQAKAPV